MAPEWVVVEYSIAILPPAPPPPSLSPEPPLAVIEPVPAKVPVIIQIEPPAPPPPSL